MLFDFTKMQSLGNDFIVLDGVTKQLDISPQIARRLADRHFGVGCDQILLAEPGIDSDFIFRIFNQDGSEVEQCGNGARCFADFVRKKGLVDRDQMTVQTINSRMQLNIQPDGSVTVKMGVPEFNPVKIPFHAEQVEDVYLLHLATRSIEISAVAIGNPHAVVLVPEADQASVIEQGAEIESHERFPVRVNAGFMQVVSRSRIRLRVFERGVGETLGCGSGACAAVAVGVSRGMLDSKVIVSLPGGDATVEWAGPGHPIYLSGSVHTVYSGVIDVGQIH